MTYVLAIGRLVELAAHLCLQADLEAVLFSIVRSKGFDEQYIDCYKMVTQFYQQRQPLCIIICGTAWTGKSTIAQQLAARINIPNVMQTDIVYELLRAGGDSPLAAQPLWSRPGLSDAALVGEFRREARVVRKGMDGDLTKTLSDGKPIIIEGMHLDPGLYIQDFGRSSIIMLPARPTPTAAAVPSKCPLRCPGIAAFGRSLASLQAQASSEQPTKQAVAAGTTFAAVKFGRSISASAEVSIIPPTAEDVQRRQQQQQQQQQQQEQQGQEAHVHEQAAAQQPQQRQHLQQYQPQLQSRQQQQPGHQLLAQTGQPWVQALQLQQLVKSPQQQLQDDWQVHSSTSAAAAAVPCTATTATPIPSPSVVMMGPFHVCAATAEAVALRQHQQRNRHSPSAQQQQQQRHHQQQRQQQSPISPSGQSVDSDGEPSGVSPCLSQEHSTTEVVSRQTSVTSMLSPQASVLDTENASHALVTTTIGLADLHRISDTANEPGGLKQQIQEQQQRQQGQGMKGYHRHSAPELYGTAGGAGHSSNALESSFAAVTVDSTLAQPWQGSAQQQQQQQRPHAVQHTMSTGLQPALRLQPGQEGDGSQAISGRHATGQQPQQCQGQQHHTGYIEPQAAGTASQQEQPNRSNSTSKAAVGDLPGVYNANQQQFQVTGHVLQQQAKHPVPKSSALNGHLGSLQYSGQRHTARMDGSSGQQEPSSQHSAAAANPAVVAAAPANLQAGIIGPSAAATTNAAGTSQARSSQASSISTHGQHSQLSSGQKAEDRVHKPLFVPVLVCMDEADHMLMAEEALAHCSSVSTSAEGAGGSIRHAILSSSSTAVDTDKGRFAGATAAAAVHTLGNSGDSASDSLQAGTEPHAKVAMADALHRMRLLQDYLCAYEAQGLPVVKVSYGNFGEALDKLHEYILQCIKVAMLL
eukprot:GHRR01008828.1.p1 GENE.GHRR01008828.1~~GHRR01008828.1.p1  ORF type:complete len:921 (+),score=400.41 GHRR01008828.1:941-3703(+)